MIAKPTSPKTMPMGAAILPHGDFAYAPELLLVTTRRKG